MAVSGTALGTSLGINGLVALCCFMAFSILRRHSSSRKYYSPKRYDSERKRKPKRLPVGLLSWIPHILRYPEAEIINVCGLDTAVFLRLLRLGIILFFWVTLWVFATVVPVNATGGFLTSHTLGDPIPICKDRQQAQCNTTNSDATTPARCVEPQTLQLTVENCLMYGNNSNAQNVVLACNSPKIKPFCADGSDPVCSTTERPLSSDLDILSLSNVAPRSQRMWMHLISTYLVSFLAMKLLWDFSRDVAQLRVKFLGTLPRGGQTYSVLVTDIPGIPYGTVMQRLHQMLDGTLGRFLPQSVKDKINAAYASTVNAVASGDPRKLVTSRNNGPNDPGVDAGVDIDQLDQNKKGRDSESYLVVSQVIGKSRLVNNEAAIQEKLRSGLSVNGVVEEEMRTVYGARNVAASNAVYNQDTLGPLVNKYNGMMRQLEDLLDDYMGKVRRRIKVQKRHQTTVIGPLWGSWATQKYGNKAKVDSLQFLPEALRHLKMQIKQEQEKARAGTPLPAAFVTFQNRMTACQAATGLHCHNETYWCMQESPGAKEVVWENLSMRKWERAIRTILIWALFVTIIIFYLPVIAIIQVPVNLENLRKVDGLKVLVDLPFIRQILEGVLPSIVLVVFLAILPMLLTFMARRQGLVSLSHIDRTVVEKYFLFLFFAVLVFNFISGSALSQIQVIIDNPASLISLLGVAAPQQASFFMTYILLRGLSGAPIGLLRIVGLVLFRLFSKIAATPKAKRRLWADQELPFGPTIPLHSLVLTLGLAFSCINPLIAPVTLLYFVMVSIVERYQWIYVFDHGYEAGGKLWKEIFNQVMVAIYTFQVLMACLLGIKKFAYTPIIIPLPILTFMFHRGVLSALTRPWSLMSSQEAAFLDHMDVEKRKKEGLPAEFTADELTAVSTEYLSPVMKVSESELEELLGQAAMVDEAIKALDRGRPHGDVEEPDLLGKSGTSGHASDHESEDHDADIPVNGKDADSKARS